MAITLRDNKGAPLTHEEMDTNFREFFYSGSIHESDIRLFRSRSLNPEFSIPYTPPSGQDTHIQIKSGSGVSGADGMLTGSSNFTFDYDSNIFKVTASTNIQGNVEIDGVLTAESYITTTVSASVLYESGSSQFGNSSDDTHTFTGSVNITGSVTADDYTGIFIGALSSSAQIASEISGAFTPASSSFSTRITAQELFSSSIDDTFVTEAELNTATSSLSSSLASDIATNLSNNTALDGEVTSLNAFTGSATRSSAISGSITTFSSSIALRVTAQEAFSSSADTTFATNASINTATASLSASLSLDIAKNAATGSDHETRISTLEDTTLLSGSAQVLSGSGVFSSSAQLPDGLVSGSPQVVTLLDGQDISVNSISASIYHEIYTTQSINLGSGSFQFGDSIDDTHVFTGSMFITGGLSVTGIISASDDIIAFASSDERLKDNVTPIGSALSKINQIGGYEFDWNSDSSHSGHDVGVIAQEIEKVLPEVVTTRDNGYMAVRYEKIVALLIEAIKEQQLQIDELKSKL